MTAPVTTTLTSNDCRAAPKILLHDHLDGGLRPSTILELADVIGHDLPASDAASLARWFHQGADRRDLSLYLDTFTHTVAVMQRPDHLERVAWEAGIDLADDGVVHAELRFAPELNTLGGMGLDDVLEAATAGVARAMRDRDITLRIIVTAMRTADNAAAAAAAAVRWADRGVVGFDLAGAEAGYPPARHLDAIRTARAAGLGVTLHAGEAYGLASIREAVVVCGADRLGHGVRLVDDLGEERGEDGMGDLARRVKDDAIVLETCPSSNLHTGAVVSMLDHPADRLLSLGFAVTINTDNRLMSATTVTEELERCVVAWGWGVDRVAAVLSHAASAVFGTDAERETLRAKVAAWADATAGIVGQR